MPKPKTPPKRIPKTVKAWAIWMENSYFFPFYSHPKLFSRRAEALGEIRLMEIEFYNARPVRVEIRVVKP